MNSDNRLQAIPYLKTRIIVLKCTQKPEQLQDGVPENPNSAPKNPNGRRAPDTHGAALSDEVPGDRRRRALRKISPIV